MDLYRLYYFSLAFQGCISLALALWLWVKAGKRAGIKPLVMFCAGIGLWGLGQLAIQLGDEHVARIGKILVNLGPFNAVCFLHFVFRFLDRRRPRELLAWYAATAALVAVIMVFDMGRLEPWLGFRRYYIFPAWGWIPGIYVSTLSIWAYFLLLREWPGAAPKLRGKIMAIWLSGIWGSASTLMFLNASFGIAIFPYSMILLPGYALLLVFGILRYDLMAVNLWANRVLVWLVLTAATVTVAGLLLSVAARTGFAPLAAVPLWQLWLLGTAMLGVALALEGPARRAMEKLVFPGAHLEAGVLAAWRVRLDAAASWAELESVASATLATHLRQPLAVALGKARPGDLPCVYCHQDGPDQAPHWRSDLIGWEGATPSVQRVGEVFGALLAAAAARLDQLLRYAEQEKNRLLQAHLLELGGLAATVAHELRNPLNIISMAALACPPETRAEIRAQIERADHLIQDLLSYSGEVRLQCRPVALAELLRHVASGQPSVNIEIAVDEPLQALIDPWRGEQIFNNLIGNAMAMLRGRPDPRVRVEGAGDGAGRVILRVCDNGPGVAADLVADLFQPFTTRRPGGTGLGLAIVRRLVEAHGGTVRLCPYPGWNCCFEVILPGLP
ncbi:hypothetical protein AAKU55_002982 [Oxalobacteraceae bacterium GrIS 1.11]